MSLRVQIVLIHLRSVEQLTMAPGVLLHLGTEQLSWFSLVSNLWQNIIGPACSTAPGQLTLADSSSLVSFQYQSSAEIEITTFTPASNLGYLALQDNFHWCQNVHWEPWMRNEGVLKIFWYALCENAWFPWQPIADLRKGVCLQKYSYLSCYLS